MSDSKAQAGYFTRLFSFRKPSRANLLVPARDATAPVAADVSYTAAMSKLFQSTPDVYLGDDSELPSYTNYANTCLYYEPRLHTSRSENPRSYTPEALSSDNAFRADVLKTVEDTLEIMDSELRKLSLDIWEYPELLWEERHAHDTLTGFMSEHGFEVTQHYLDFPTAWRAVYTHTSSAASDDTNEEANIRAIGINSEMDALPGIGHACGHNLVAMAGVGVALAIKAALEKHDVSGKIILLGTPAEEGGGGKILLLERGAYDEMDACIMCHPNGGPVNHASLASSLASQPIDVEFLGHSAHASSAPWEGQNALDAAFLAYSSISMLRQQIKPTHRVHGIVTGKDWAPNVIPDNATMRWIVRAPTWGELEVLRERVKACFEAAALAAACKVTVKAGLGYWDLRQNKVLGDQFSHIVKQYGVTSEFDEVKPASTDFGNITYALPSLLPGYSIPTQANGENHTPEFTMAAATPEAHTATLTIVKGLAAAGFRVLDDAAFAMKVKKAWEEDMESNKICD